MSALVKNIFVGVICLALAYIGYILITDSSELTSGGLSDQVQKDNLITKTEIFIERSNVLAGIKIDQSLFTDPVFTSLRSFTTPVPEQMVGKDSLFDSNNVVDSN